MGDIPTPARAAHRSGRSLLSGRTAHRRRHADMPIAPAPRVARPELDSDRISLGRRDCVTALSLGLARRSEPTPRFQGMCQMPRHSRQQAVVGSDALRTYYKEIQAAQVANEVLYRQRTSLGSRGLSREPGEIGRQWIPVCLVRGRIASRLAHSLSTLVLARPIR